MGGVAPRIVTVTCNIPQLRANGVKDFGCGNFTVLKRIVEQVAKLGVQGICLEPIHEVAAGGASPFGRTSMNALNHRLLDIAEVPEIKQSSRLKSLYERVVRQGALQPSIRKTNLGRVEVGHLSLMEMAYQRFRENNVHQNERLNAFLQFSEKHAWWFDAYAYFKVLEETYGGLPVERWDLAFADMNGDKARRFRGKHQGRLSFYKYLQMEIYRQAKEAFAYAHEKGIQEIEMLIGTGISP